MRRITLVAGIALVCACTAAAEPPPVRLAVSIYNGASSNGDALFEVSETDAAAPGGYAVVRDSRKLDLTSGVNVLQVHDVARWLDSGAVSVRLVGDASDAEILSQRFENEPLSLDTLAQRQIGHNVDIVSGDGPTGGTTISGILLSNGGGLSVRLADGRVTTITEYSRVTFPDLPKGLAAAPTLRWDVVAKKAGTHNFEIVYPTQGLGWRAEYSAWLAPGSDCKVDFSAWAQIANRSGTDFHGAQVKLIAGEPHRVAQASMPSPKMMAPTRAAGGAIRAEDSGNAGDYHEYTLDAPVDLTSGSLLRVALYSAQPLPCQRQYLFESSHLRVNPGMAPITDRGYGGDEHLPVLSTLGLHIDRPLPAGRIRVIEDASDGAAEFVGEDHIGHTPRGEPVTIDLGEAFDLRGERSQTDFQIDKDKRSINESFAIHLINRSAHVQTLTVREHLYRWTQWNIVQSSTKYEKRNADTMDFKLDVPANGDAKLTYTVQYQWTESYK